MSPRRSLHFVPGGDEPKFHKALGLPADALIFDLEDSVPPSRKEAARQEVCNWLKECGGVSQELIVRVNPLDSDWGRADLEAVLPCHPAAVMLPKVESREMVQAADSLLAAAESNGGTASKTIASKIIDPNNIGLILIGTETPGAVFQLPLMTGPERVQGLTWGAEDLSACLGCRRTRDDRGEYLDVFRQVRSLCLLAAVAGGVQPIDTVFTDIRDLEGLRAEAALAADMGFTGKLTIHPAQIDIVNAVFTPSAEEVAEAKELLDQFAEHEKQGKAVFAFRGQMVDVPHLKKAQRILALAGNN